MDNDNKSIMETEPFEMEDENTNMKMKLNSSNNDNKKKILIYVVCGVILLILIGVAIYIVIGKKDDKNTPNDNSETKVETGDKDSNKDNNKNDNIGYVSCDDNVSLLNVRNSTSGDIIDGLSCYKLVNIEEEIHGTENCKKWYKINYTKRGNSYTGYACATYIKNDDIDKDTIDIARSIIDKANDYYENNVLVAYCGDNTGETKNIEYNEDGNTFTGYYVKSKYKNLDELKRYLLTFLDESLINPELKLSDINNKKMYDNYYEINGNLYCRNYSGKGWNTRYTGNYDIEITNNSDDKISLNIAYEYLKEDSTCDIKNLSKCSNSNFEYAIGKAIIQKINGNYLITKIDFHE